MSLPNLFSSVNSVQVTPRVPGPLLITKGDSVKPDWIIKSERLFHLLYVQREPTWKLRGNDPVRLQKVYLRTPSPSPISYISLFTSPMSLEDCLRGHCSETVGTTVTPTSDSQLVENLTYDEFSFFNCLESVWYRDPKSEILSWNLKSWEWGFHLDVSGRKLDRTLSKQTMVQTIFSTES